MTPFNPIDKFSTMERVEAVVQSVKRKNTKATTDGSQKKAKTVATGKGKSNNLRIHNAYAHASLFKEFASMSTKELPSGKWEITVNFKNNNPVITEVDDEKERAKVVKKVLYYQKKFGVEEPSDKSGGDPEDDKDEELLDESENEI